MTVLKYLSSNNHKELIEMVDHVVSFIYQVEYDSEMLNIDRIIEGFGAEIEVFKDKATELEAMTFDSVSKSHENNNF